MPDCETYLTILPLEDEQDPTNAGSKDDVPADENFILYNVNIEQHNNLWGFWLILGSLGFNEVQVS